MESVCNIDIAFADIRYINGIGTGTGIGVRIAGIGTGIGAV